MNSVLKSLRFKKKKKPLKSFAQPLSPINHPTLRPKVAQLWPQSNRQHLQENTQTATWMPQTDNLSCAQTHSEGCILHSFLSPYSCVSVRNVSQLPLCAESDLGVFHSLLSTWLCARLWVGWKTERETEISVSVVILATQYIGLYKGVWQKRVPV